MRSKLKSLQTNRFVVAIILVANQVTPNSLDAAASLSARRCGQLSGCTPPCLTCYAELDRFCPFVMDSPTPFQAVSNIIKRLLSAGFKPLSEPQPDFAILKPDGKVSTLETNVPSWLSLSHLNPHLPPRSPYLSVISMVHVSKFDQSVRGSKTVISK